MTDIAQIIPEEVKTEESQFVFPEAQMIETDPIVFDEPITDDLDINDTVEYSKTVESELAFTTGKDNKTFKDSQATAKLKKQDRVNKVLLQKAFDIPIPKYQFKDIAESLINKSFEPMTNGESVAENTRTTHTNDEVKRFGGNLDVALGKGAKTYYYR